MSGSKDKKDANAAGSVIQRRKGKKEKLIRLDDLIPKEDILGGRQLLFGATYINQTTNKQKEN